MDCPHDTTKQAVLTLLARGEATLAEAAWLSGRSRQIVRHWARELPKDSRPKHLRKQWAEALKSTRKDSR